MENDCVTLNKENVFDFVFKLACIHYEIHTDTYTCTVYLKIRIVKALKAYEYGLHCY